MINLVYLICTHNKYDRTNFYSYIEIRLLKFVLKLVQSLKATFPYVTKSIIVAGRGNIVEVYLHVNFTFLFFIISFFHFERKCYLKCI